MPEDAPHPDGLAATGPTATPAEQQAAQPPTATLNLVVSGGSEPISPNDASGRPLARTPGARHGGTVTGGQRETLHRMDGYSTTSEYIRWAEQVRSDCMRRHDAFLQHAAQLEAGIRKTSRWPWPIDKIVVARRASRPLRQCAGAEMDQARRLAASVRVLVALRDAPKLQQGVRGFDVTK